MTKATFQNLVENLFKGIEAVSEERVTRVGIEW